MKVGTPHMRRLDLIVHAEGAPFVDRCEMKSPLRCKHRAGSDVEFITSFNVGELKESVTDHVQKAVATALGSKVIRALNGLGEVLEQSDRDEVAAKIEADVKAMQKARAQRR